MNNLKIGITGVSGLIGWHLRAFIEIQNIERLKVANRNTFQSKDALIEFVNGVDVIIHLAGKCRGSRIIESNNNIDHSLIEAIEASNTLPHIIFSSSTHIEINQSSEYAQSKILSAKNFQQWSSKTGSKFTNVIIPHVFGENGKAFHNSVVSTFCQQISDGEKIKLLLYKNLDLVHAQNLAKQIYEIARESIVGNVRIKGVPIKVSQVMSKLIMFDQLYRKQLIPKFENNLDLELFNTYRSYLPKSFYPVYFEQHSDERGMLFEAVKTLNKSQCFVSTTKPGITRGNHYHHEKIERFVVLSGRARSSLRKKYQNRVVEYLVDGDHPSYVDIPTFHTHKIENIGDSEMTVLFWSHQLYDPDDADTYFEEVVDEK